MVNNEYIVISGEILENGKFQNFKIVQMNLVDIRTNIIMNKLISSNLAINDKYNLEKKFDKFTIYIGAKPEYENTTDNIVLLNLSNDKIIQNKKIFQAQIAKYYSEIFEQVFQQNWNKIYINNPEIDKIFTVALEIDCSGKLKSINILNSISKELDNIMLSSFSKDMHFGSFPNEWGLDNVIFFYNFNFAKYLEEKIKNNASPAILMQDYYSLIKVSLDNKGNVVASEIVDSSGNSIINNELMKTIRKIGNFSKFLHTCSYDEKNYFISVRNMQNKISGFKFNVLWQVTDEQTKNPTNWNLFMEKVEKQAKLYWNNHVYRAKNDYKVVVLVKLSKEGLVLNKNIIKSSGIKEADEVVLMSIDKGAPYPKIQEDYTGESITIELTYEYAINKKLYEKNHFESKYYKLIQQTSQPANYNQNYINTKRDLLLK